MPTISVCIVTYNSASDIEACLDAISGQSHRVEKIVVVDNASSDGSVEAVENWNGNTRLIRNSVNNGFAGGQNQAIAQTDSEYVLVLNPDVILGPDYITETVAFMERNLSAGSATGQLVLADDPDKMDSAGLAMKRDRQVYDMAAGDPVSSWGQNKSVFGVSGAAAVYRSEMIRAISYEGQFFDETFFAYKEDVDVAWRARHFGWTAWYIPSAKARHRRAWKKGRRSSIPLFVRRHSYQNRFFTLIKNEPAGWHWLALLPYLLAIEGMKFGYIVLREPKLLTCWSTIFRKMPGMLKKRRWLFKQSRRSV